MNAARSSQVRPYRDNRVTAYVETHATPAGISGIPVPAGLLGRLGWPLVRPFFAYGVQLSLRRFARQVERVRMLRELAGREARVAIPKLLSESR